MAESVGSAYFTARSHSLGQDQALASQHLSRGWRQAAPPPSPWQSLAHVRRHVTPRGEGSGAGPLASLRQGRQSDTSQ